MLNLAEINALVNKAASASLKRSVRISRVLSEPTTDSAGEEALRIIIVLANRGADRMNGDTALQMLVTIDTALLEAGDDRLPIVEFANEEEMDLSGDSEP